MFGAQQPSAAATTSSCSTESDRRVHHRMMAQSVAGWQHGKQQGVIGYPSTVERRVVLAIALGAIVAVLFAAVATSGSVRYADGPPSFLDQLDDVQSATEISIETVEGEAAEEREDAELSPFVELAMRIVLWTLIALATALVVAKLWRERPSFGWRRHRPSEEPFDVLPDVAAAIAADATAQRAALQTGAPRDAIVACWLRLEASVIAAGIERRPSDTSTELTERVLTGYRVDPVSLATLAGLYREARFSEHEMSEASRVTAFDALDRVHTALSSSVTAR